MPSVSLSFFLTIYLSGRRLCPLSICLPVFLSIFLPPAHVLCLSVCLYFCLSFCPQLMSSVYLSVYLSGPCSCPLATFLNPTARGNLHVVSPPCHSPEQLSNFCWIFSQKEKSAGKQKKEQNIPSGVEEEDTVEKIDKEGCQEKE